MAALAKLESAYQRQHTAAVDSCGMLADTGDRVKERKTRVQQTSVEAVMETFREAGAYHAGGRDVATLVALLGTALRNGQQQCILPPPLCGRSRPGRRPGHARETALVLPRTASPSHSTCPSSARHWGTKRSACNHPGIRSRGTGCGGRSPGLGSSGSGAGDPVHTLGGQSNIPLRLPSQDLFV